MTGENQKENHRWCIQHVIVPILGGGGLIAIIVAYISSPPLPSPGPNPLPPKPDTKLYSRECEYPDNFSVGMMIYRSQASEEKVHGRFGAIDQPPYEAKSGYVEYQRINLPDVQNLKLTIKYSKNSDSSVPIEIYIDHESKPRSSFFPKNQKDWDRFAWSDELLLGKVISGLHSIKFVTKGQQYGVADLDQFILKE